MKKTCAWCKKDLEPVESEESMDKYITHGVCHACAKKIYRELSRPLRSFLDSFKVPILLIGPDPKVLTANISAQNLLGKELLHIEGYKGGEVIDCVHSFSDKGCGEDVHCESCTIRNTVLKTFATGESFQDVPAYPDIQRIDKVRTHCIRISTEKVGELVLLRIDYMNECSEQNVTDD